MKSGELVQTKLLPLMRCIARDALRDVELLRFDKKRHQHIYLVCVYGSILEIAYGCIVLLDSRQTTALPILLRSLLEAYADFRAIVEDSGYFKNMNASFLREKMRLLKSADQNQQNPYLAELVQAQNISKEQADLDAAMAMYRKDDRGPLDNWQRFERGKLQYEYQSIYWLLCLHGHNNLSALEDRHIEKQGEDYNVVLFREEDPEDYLRYVDTLISILIDSTEVIHRLLGATTAPYYQQYRESFAAVRTNYSTSSQARC